MPRPAALAPALALLLVIGAVATSLAPRSALPPVAGYRVVDIYPHDSSAFTQGLAYVDGVLYEGTGLLSGSTLRRVDLDTGEVLQSVALGADQFGEGIAVVGDRIYQLTWQTGTCFVYDSETFERLETLLYPSEGWGLTTDGERLIMSDGTSRLYFRDPATFAETGFVDVRAGDRPVENLNELEWVDGEVWANVWQTDWIARIDPVSGRVIGWIDLAGLLSLQDRGDHSVDVLNGIAYDASTGRVFVTGKLWPKLFEVEMVPLL
jgi:glutamine cyclotransferase